MINLKNAKFPLFFSFLITPNLCFAHGAHEHGVAKIDIAYTKNNIQINFEIPSVDIYGFEHTAKSEKDKEALEKGTKNFETNFLKIFQLNSNLDCKVTSSKIEPFVKEEDPEAEEVLFSAEHGNFRATYKLNCKQSPEKSPLYISFKTTFPSIHKLVIQTIGDKIQNGLTVNSGEGKINL
jgi:hypothetical protein